MLQRRNHRSPQSRFVPNAQTVWSGASAADLFADRLREKQQGLSRTMSRVVRYIEQNRVAVLASSAAEIARRTRTSDATVIRTVQALGFAGLAEMRQELITDLQRSSPAEGMSRTLKETGESADRAIELVLDTHTKGLDQLRWAQPQIVEAIGHLDRATRIVIFGVGPTALLAEYAAFTYGVPAGRPMRSTARASSSPINSSTCVPRTCCSSSPMAAPIPKSSASLTRRSGCRFQLS